jgi:midasin (ATPase involved in ribosome maturation)
MKFVVIGSVTNVEVIAAVEVHWYEAHGIGKRDLKIKRYLDE